MPVIDGFDLAKYIGILEKSKKVGKKCPIIAVTAFVSEEVKKKAEELEIKKVLSKPVDQKEIYKVIKPYLLDNT